MSNMLKYLDEIQSGVFIVDYDNWRSFKSNIYGYKLDDLRNGAYFEFIKDEENDTLLITGSYCRPVIYIFRHDVYWCISNSCYFMSEYLTEKGYTLTNNIEFEKFSIGNQYGPTVSSLITPFNEINIPDMFTDLLILPNNQLNVEIKENTVGSVSIIDAMPIIEDWYTRYYDKLHYLAKNELLRMDLSGGMDSRINFGILRDLPKEYLPQIHMDDGKIYSDNTFGDTDKKTALSILEENKVDIEYNQNKKLMKPKTRKYFESSLPYIWGSQCWRSNPIIDDPSKFTHQVPYDSESYKLVGVGGELYRSYIRSYALLSGWLRRYPLNNHYDAYFRKRIKIICPLLDSELLKIDASKDGLLHAIIYVKYFEDLLDIRFTGGKGDYYWLSEGTLNEARSIIKRYNEMTDISTRNNV